MKDATLNRKWSPLLRGVGISQGESAWYGDIAGSLQHMCAACDCGEADLLWSGVIHIAVWLPLKRNSFWGFVFHF